MASAASDHQRREGQHQQRGAHEVEGALDRELDAVQHRRLELEQRQRLTGHELRPVHEDLHRRRRHANPDAVLVAALDELDGLLLGEVGVGDQHLVDGVEVALELLERAEVAKAVEERHRRARDEAVGLDDVRVAERVGDRLDVGAGADQHGAAAIAGGAQHHGGGALEQPAQQRHVEQREEERGVEDVVRLEGLALDRGVDQHHERDLEQRRDHAREAGPLAAVAVEPRAGEQQQHHERGQREVLVGLAPHLVELLGRANRRLHHQRRVDREEQADQVQRAERADAHQGTQGVEAQDAAEDQRLARAHVAVGQGDRLDLPQLFDQALRHGFLPVHK